MQRNLIRQIIIAAAISCAGAVSALAQKNKDILPPGPGHDAVVAACSGCHELSRIPDTYGMDRAIWDIEVGRMVQMGAPVTAANHDEIVNYLATHFPALPKPPGVVVPGPVNVTIREWNAPTADSFPHDPFGAADGSLWWTGWIGNTVGRLNPKTGQMKEYRPKTPGSGPHGIMGDKQGNIWFTANTHGYIGRLDPKTGEVKEYPMPDPNVRDPHTLVFDQSGILWFTAQNANMLGRLDPKTGEIKLKPASAPHTLPYGMVVTSKGVPVFDEFGANKIGTIDPNTMAIRDYLLPDRASRPRRIAITSDDRIWYTDYSRGYIGRLDLDTGKVKEWASPSGPHSQPYGMTAVKDVIWYAEANSNPNMLVRFDPKTEKFQSWKIPGGGGVVRNMSPMPDGGIALAESGVNKVALATVH